MGNYEKLILAQRSTITEQDYAKKLWLQSVQMIVHHCVCILMKIQNI